MNFPKHLKNSDFQKCVKSLPVEKIRIFDVFLSRKDPLMTPVPNFNKCYAISNFLFKNIVFGIFTPKTRLVKEIYF